MSLLIFSSIENANRSYSLSVFEYVLNSLKLHFRAWSGKSLEQWQQKKRQTLCLAKPVPSTV